MKRKMMVPSLKCALAFMFCCLCIFVYSQQASVLGGNAVQAEKDHCCKHCGSVESCEEGGFFEWGYEHCDIDWDVKPPSCEVSGNYCNCDS